MEKEKKRIETLQKEIENQNKKIEIQKNERLLSTNVGNVG